MTFSILSFNFDYHIDNFRFEFRDCVCYNLQTGSALLSISENLMNMTKLLYLTLTAWFSNLMYVPYVGDKL